MNCEIKAIGAPDMLEVYLADRTPGNPSVESKVFENETRLGTSIIVGSRHTIEFENPNLTDTLAYLGVVV